MALAPAMLHARQAGTDSHAQLRDRDTTLQDIGWRLQRGNARFCTDVVQAAGMTVDDASAYADPAAMRAANAIRGDFAVQTVAMDSPAERAGLRPGMEIAAVDGHVLAELPADPERRWHRMVLIAMMLTDPDPARARMTVSTDRPAQTFTVPLVPVCATRFETGLGFKDAVADGSRVVIDRDFIGFTYPESQFAAILAHELAHNVLRHRSFLDANGRTKRDVRRTEREADRLMPWLLANAGYDPRAAARFMRRWGPDHARRSGRHHDDWETRLALIERELPLVAASIAARGAADWSQDFQRQRALP